MVDVDLSFQLPMFPFNTDGIDILGRNVLIERCNITNYDDAVAIKPLKRDNDKSLYKCSENIMVRDMILH